MKLIVGENSGWLHMLVWLGLFGLIASFHGIILGYSRQIYALAREAYLPSYFAKIHPRFKTPHRAIIAGGVVGIAAIYSDELIKFGGQTLTANIVTMSVFGAITMYIISMLALFKLRRAEPEMARPFRAFLSIVPGDCTGGRGHLHGHHDLLQLADLLRICGVPVAGLWLLPCDRAAT
jgi:ethanolamine permease